MPLVNLPGWQRLQVLCCFALEKLPGSQFKHDDACVCAWKVPSLHGVHCRLPSCDANCPIAQGKQVLPPPGLNVPTATTIEQ